MKRILVAAALTIAALSAQAQTEVIIFKSYHKDAYVKPEVMKKIDEAVSCGVVFYLTPIKDNKAMEAQFQQVGLAMIQHGHNIAIDNQVQTAVSLGLAQIRQAQAGDFVNTWIDNKNDVVKASAYHKSWMTKFAACQKVLSQVMEGEKQASAELPF